jgi:hypothetical protein
MSSPREKDIIDFFDDDTQNEDGTDFIPVRPDTGPDSWTAFFGGLLTAISGGALLAEAPWLGGAMVGAGYAVAAYGLRGARSRFAASLRFSFVLFAVLGALVLAADIVASQTVWPVVAVAGKKGRVFLGVALLPWVIAFVKYVVLLIWSPRVLPRSGKP